MLDENQIKNGIPKERILMTHEANNKGSQKNSGWNYKIDFVYSDDFFKTMKIGAHKGNKFILTNQYLFLAQVLDQDVQEVMLLTANSNEKSYNFQHVELGKNKLREHSYTFLDTSANSVFIHVNHFGDKSSFGHIYNSDEQGVNYAHSVSYNVKSPDGECDFSKVIINLTIG